METITEIIPDLDEPWMMDALNRGQLWNEVIYRLKCYESALKDIVELRGSFDIPRHECTAMANRARSALEVINRRNRMEKIRIKADADLDNCNIEFIQQIENDLDEVMTKNGFTRTTTSKKGNVVDFNYRQFGVCL